MKRAKSLPGLLWQAASIRWREASILARIGVVLATVFGATALISVFAGCPAACSAGCPARSAAPANVIAPVDEAPAARYHSETTGCERRNAPH
ncbi:MAG: hypothetical protein AAF411_08745 [Myxococcota bacterium]